MIQLRKLPTPDERPAEATIVSPKATVPIYGPRNVSGGGWHHVMMRESKDGPAKAVPRIYCPKCGNEGLLDHDIDTEGRVTPSLVCPHDGCDFHDHIQLMGWES